MKRVTYVLVVAIAFLTVLPIVYFDGDSEAILHSSSGVERSSSEEDLLATVAVSPATRLPESDAEFAFVGDDEQQRVQEIELVSKSDGRALSGYVGCLECGTHAPVAPGEMGKLHHRLVNADGHSVWGRSSGFEPGQVLGQKAGGSGYGSATIELRPRRMGVVTLRLDEGMPNDGLNPQLSWRVAPGHHGYSNPAGAFSSASVISRWVLQHSEGEAGMTFCAEISPGQPFCLIPGAGGPLLGPIQPGDNVVVDMRQGSNCVSLSSPDGPVSGTSIVAYEKAGARFFPRVTDANGDTWLPNDVEGELVVELDQRSPYLLAMDQPPGVTVPQARDSASVARFVESLALRVSSRGWKFQLQSAAHGEPITAPVTVSAFIGTAGGEQVVAASRIGHTDRRGIFATSLCIPPSTPPSIELKIDVPGYLPATIQLNGDVSSALTNLQSDGYKVHLQHGLPQYRLVVNEVHGSLLGRIVSISLPGRSSPVARVPIRTDGRSTVFSLSPGSYSVKLDGSSKVIAGLLLPDVSDIEVLQDVELEFRRDGLSVLEVSTGGPARITLFAAGKGGAVWPLERHDRESGGSIWTTRLVPGNYVIGPIEWVANEAHRLQFRDFGVMVTEDAKLVQVRWNPRWCCEVPVETKITLSGDRKQKAVAIPVFEEASQQFYSDFAPVTTGVTGRQTMTVMRGDPIPIGYLLRAPVDGFARESVPVGFVLTGEATVIDFGHIRVPPTPPGLGLGELPMFCKTLVPALPTCLSEALGERLIERNALVVSTIGPLDVSRVELYIGDPPEWNRIYPDPSEVSAFRVEVTE